MGATVTRPTRSRRPAPIGYVRRDGAFVEEPFDGYGALASMGGIFSSVRDLAIWVAGFTVAFPRGTTRRAASAVTRVASEMQQVHRPFDPSSARIDRGGAGADQRGVRPGPVRDVRTAPRPHRGSQRRLSGVGSHTRWHPTSGLGVIALGNRTYAHMSTYAAEALAALISREAARIRSVVPWNATRIAGTQMETLLRLDDDLAAEVFAFNADLDDPFERRRAEIELIRQIHRTLSPDPGVLPVESDSPAHLAWWLRGTRRPRPGRDPAHGVSAGPACRPSSCGSSPPSVMARRSGRWPS